MKQEYRNELTAAFAAMARTHNETIDNFINVTLKEHFGKDELNMKEWFEAQRLIGEQNFYKRGHAILVALRDLGVDCKMNMQSNKLVCAELGL